MSRLADPPRHPQADTYFPGGVNAAPLGTTDPAHPDSIAPAASPTPGRFPTKAIAAATMGHAVEWFDWTIYSLFAVYFATQIFPKGDPTAALLMTFATFAAAFFLRPFGGWIMGRMADMPGRRGAMMLCVALMAGGSFVIGALPTFLTRSAGGLPRS